MRVLRPAFGLAVTAGLLGGCFGAEPTDLSDAFGLAVPHFTHARAVDVTVRADAGVRWVRRDISWDEVERTPGTFDFSEADRVIDNERAGGVKVLAILDYGHPAYATGATGVHQPPDDLEDFGRYVTVTVEHFRDRVDAWEIWNEPNFLVFWKPAPDPRRYGELLKVASARIRDAAPGAPILLGGMLGNNDTIFYDGGAWAFLEDAIEAHPDLLEHVDVLSVHPYTWLQFVPPEAPSGLVHEWQVSYADMILEMRRIAGEAGREDLRLWITEQGWHTAVSSELFPGVSETEQAALMVRSCVLAIALGAEKLFPFTYADGAGPKTDKESHFGMVRYDPDLGPEEAPQTKPAYDAYRTMTRLLAPTRFDTDLRGTIELPEDGLAFSFVGPHHTVVVAWSVLSSGHPLRLWAPPVRVMDTLGTPIGGPNSPLILTPRPIFIEVSVPR